MSYKLKNRFRDKNFDSTRLVLVLPYFTISTYYHHQHFCTAVLSFHFLKCSHNFRIKNLCYFFLKRIIFWLLKIMLYKIVQEHKKYELHFFICRNGLKKTAIFIIFVVLMSLTPCAIIHRRHSDLNS